MFQNMIPDLDMKDIDIFPFSSFYESAEHTECIRCGVSMNKAVEVRWFASFIDLQAIS